MLDRIVNNSDTLTWFVGVEKVEEFLRDALEVISNGMEVNISKMTGERMGIWKNRPVVVTHLLGCKASRKAP
jgi:hypothetical protein